MFCKHFIKIFVGVPSFNGETSRMGGCEVRGAHSIFLIKNMKSATAFCLDRLCFSDSASCYLSLWNAVAVYIFLRNTPCTLRLIQVYERGALLPCILAVPDLFHWREILSGTFFFLKFKAHFTYAK